MTETRTPVSSSLIAIRTRLRPILVMLIGFLVVSTAMEAVLVTQSVTGTSVADSVWIRCSLVLASSVVLLLIAIRASRGSRAAWIRLRIITVVVVVAIVVIVSIPGFLPGWVRIEQGLCGALVLPAAIMLNLRGTAVLYPTAPRQKRA